MYLQAGGALGGPRPDEREELGSWRFDPAAGTGEAGFSKWDNAAGPPQREGDQAVEDEWKGLTFETPPLARPLTLTGPMELRLRAATVPLAADGGLPQGLTGLGAEQVAPDHLDTDFVVKLSDVAPDGTSTLIQSGFLRASHRSVDDRRSRTGEPFHHHDPARVQPVEPGEPTSYRIEVWPTSKRFAKGHRLRVALYSADTPNHLTLLKPVENTVLGGSHLVVPDQRR
jgi:predicted acyl esterase